MPSVVLQGRIPTAPDTPTDWRPDPGLLSKINDSFWAASDAETGELQTYGEEEHAYSQLVDQLHQRGVSNPNFTRHLARDAWSLTYDRAEIWKAVQAERARDPGAFSGLPETPEKFEEQASAGKRRALAYHADLAARAGTVPRLIGNLGYGAGDPLNVVGMLMGAGEAKTIGGAILNEAAVNARLAAIEQPVVAMERAKQGKDLSPVEAATNVAEAGALGGLFGGALHVGGIGVRAAAGTPAGQAVAGVAATVREKTIAGLWDVMPEAVRQRWGDASKITDADLPELAEMVIGKDRMTPDQRAAAAVVRRESELGAANPYTPDGAGIAAHEENFATAFASILDDRPAPAPGRSAFRSDLRSSTALASGTVSGMPAREALKAKIGTRESGNSNTAANPLSTAVGKYQFLKGTWLSYYTRRFGWEGKTKEQIYALRTDPVLQDTLMNDMLADNAAFLHGMGLPETEGNLYAVHFLGKGGARKVFEADPSTSARALLGDAVVKANPFLDHMTAGDVIAWAHRRMNDSSVAGRPNMGGDGEGAYQLQLQGEVQRLRDEGNALAQQPRGADSSPAAAAGGDIAPAAPIGEPVPGVDPRAGTPDNPVPVEPHDLPTLRDEPAPAAPARAEPAAIAAGAQAPIVEGGAPTLEELRIMQLVGEHVGDRTKRLEPASVGRALGISEQQAGEALTRLAAKGEAGLVMSKGRMVPKRDAEGNFIYRDRGKNGQRVRVMEYQPGRVRRATRRSGPVDVHRFLAERGGIRDDEGHDLLRGRGMKVLVAGEGALVRPGGMTIDEAGQLLHEAGFFPLGGERPSESDVLQMLDRAMHEKVYPLHDRPVIAAHDTQEAAAIRADLEEQKTALAGWLAEEHPEFGDLPADYLEEAAGLVIEHGLDRREALIEAANRHAMDTLDAAWHESEKPSYDYRPEPDAHLGGDPGAHEGRPRPGEPGYDAFIRDEAARAELAAADGAGWEAAKLELGPIPDPASSAPFLDPDGPAISGIADSVAHDARAALDRGEQVDPAIAERQRQQAQLKAESPMQAPVDQASTIGSPLFDAADQTKFRLGEEGDERSLADIMRALDDDEAAIKAARDCL